MDGRVAAAFESFTHADAQPVFALGEAIRETHGLMMHPHPSEASCV
jgi:hypothetical protein